MPRQTLAPILTDLRGMIGDPAGESQHFTDDELQRHLDRHRTEVRFAPLEVSPTPGPGVVAYKDYFSGLENWEDGAKLYGSDFAELDAESYTAEPLRGKWVFAEHQPPPVYVTGSCYELHGAAADALDAWAAALAREFNFSSDGQRFELSQKHTQVSALARHHRGLRPAGHGTLHVGGFNIFGGL